MDMATGCHSSPRRRKRATTYLWSVCSSARAGITCAIVSPCRVIATLSPCSTVQFSQACLGFCSLYGAHRMSKPVNLAFPGWPRWRHRSTCFAASWR